MAGGSKGRARRRGESERRGRRRRVQGWRSPSRGDCTQASTNGQGEGAGRARGRTPPQCPVQPLCESSCLIGNFHSTLFGPHAYPNGDVPIKVPGRWAVVAPAGPAAGLTRGRCSAARKNNQHAAALPLSHRHLHPIARNHSAQHHQQHNTPAPTPKQTPISHQCLLMFSVGNAEAAEGREYSRDADPGRSRPRVLRSLLRCCRYSAWGPAKT